ncbi:hypothetical protein D3C85_1696130 [compost metagenome]
MHVAHEASRAAHVELSTRRRCGEKRACIQALLFWAVVDVHIDVTGKRYFVEQAKE